MTAIEQVAEWTIRLLRRIIGEIILHPDDLFMEIRGAGAAGVAVFIRTHRGDMKRVIGEGGKTFVALQKLVEMIGQANGGIRAVLLPVGEPVVGQNDKHARFVPRDDWPAETITELLRETCQACFRCERVTINLAEEGNQSTFRIGLENMTEAGALEDIESALGRLFAAIGFANGRIILIALERDAAAAR